MATLTVQKSAFEPGWSQFNLWSGKNRLDVENGNVGTPNRIDYITDWGNLGGFGDNYSRRFMGFVVPPANDNYVFFLSADDDTDLFLSTDVPPNTSVRWRNKQAGRIGRGIGKTPAAAVTHSPKGVLINSSIQRRYYELPLGHPPEAGQKYYLEAVHHNGTGGDYCCVTAVTKSEADTGSTL